MIISRLTYLHKFMKQSNSIRHKADLTKLQDLLDLKEVQKQDENVVVTGVERRSPYHTIESYNEKLLCDIPPSYHNRTARIHKRPKNVMQQGTDNTHTWVLEYDTKERWENPCMGWTSSGDSLSNLELEFPTKCAAVCYAEKRGVRWFCEQPQKKKPVKKNYAEIFAWDRRTRRSTK